MNWALKTTAGVALSVALLTLAGASNKSAGNLIIIHHADGTFTIQKKAPDGSSKDSRPGGGLVIPPQVVVPLVRVTAKKPC